MQLEIYRLRTVKQECHNRVAGKFLSQVETDFQLWNRQSVLNNKEFGQLYAVLAP